MYNHLRRLDWWLAFIALLIAGVGLLTIYKIGSVESFYFFKKQVIFLVLGFILMILTSFFDYRMLKNRSTVLMIFYFISFALLLITLFNKSIRGASNWFYLGPVSVEPIEFVKLVLVIFLAKYFSFRHIEMYRVRHLIISGIYVSLPVSIVLLQPDFGSAAVLCGIWLGVIVISGIKLRHLITLFLIIVLLFVGSWFSLLKNYQKQRILTFFNPQNDPQGSGYHVNQSLITIGSGGLWGQKKQDGESQASLKFLPEQYTDFIFAAWGEQSGLLGIFLLLMLFSLLFWRIIKIALNASNNFSRLCASGLAVMIFIQLVVNTGMNMAIMPVTGLTLPLVSYGGSSLISIFLGLGILQNIKSQN